MLSTYAVLLGAVVALKVNPTSPTSVSLAEAEGYGYKPNYGYKSCCPPKPTCGCNCGSCGCGGCGCAAKPFRDPTPKEIGCALYDIDDRLCDLADCVSELKADPPTNCRVLVYDITPDEGSTYEDDLEFSLPYDATIEEIRELIEEEYSSIDALGSAAW